MVTSSEVVEQEKMEETPAVQLIAVEIEHPEFAQLINDIREFDWKLINRLRKEDIARVRATGFTFNNNGLENQRQELKTFLLQHPSCMASDFEMIMSKLNIFGYLITQKKMEVVKKEEEKEKKRMKKTRAIKHEKPKLPPKVIVIDDEEDEGTDSEDSEDSEEEDDGLTLT